MDNNDNNLNSDAEITGDKPTQEQQIEDAAAMSAKVEALLVALRTPVGGSVSDSNPGPESEAVLEPISDSISDSISEPTADSEYLSSPAPMSEPESVPTFESTAVSEPGFEAISAPETATQPEPTSAQDPQLQTEPGLQPQPQPEPQTESESASETEPQLPPHLESIPAEKIKRAKRTKTILIVIITLLILAFLGMGALAVYVFTDQQSTQSTIKTSLQIETAVDDSKAQDRGTIQVVESPNLVQMFGKTTDQIIEQLGSNYASTKTETIQEQDNPEVKQLTTIAYSPDDKHSASSMGTTHAQNIYLSQNEQGQTIEIYFVSSIDLLGYPMATFAELTATKSTLEEVLDASGAKIAADYTYTAPTTEQFTQYVDPDAKEKKVKKETAAFNGNLQSEVAPKAFSLTITYDYGASGVADTPDKKPTQRTIYLTLR